MGPNPTQKIARLTPLAEVTAALGELTRPVKPRQAASSDAIGFVLAADVIGPRLPPRAMALRDGWAITADDLMDASGYGPVALSTKPVWVEAGDELPPGSDAVAPADIIVTGDAAAEAHGAVSPGEGVALAGSEADPAKPLRSAGQRVRALDAAAFEVAGVQQISVRVPRILIIPAREDLRLRPAVQLIARDCVARGAEPLLRDGIELDDGLKIEDCDAVMVVGGSGVGRRDRSVQALAKIGQVRAHGVGLVPGETAALGHVGSRLVLVVPGQLGSALAVWLTLGRTILARLAWQTDSEIPITVTLSRKIPSTVGLAEIVPVRHDGAQAEPKRLALTQLTQANGWLLVPAESEGFPPGAKVAIYSLP